MSHPSAKPSRFVAESKSLAGLTLACLGHQGGGSHQATPVHQWRCRNQLSAWALTCWDNDDVRLIISRYVMLPGSRDLPLRA